MPSFAFFGTSNFSVTILEELASAGLKPSVVITETDKPKGRGLKLTPPPVKLWAEEHGIPVLQPEKLDDDFCSLLTTRAIFSTKNLNGQAYYPPARASTDGVQAGLLFIVASYGKIIPPKILALPENGVLNVHPSLLPKYRGASPIQTAILNGETENGVTIMLMDEKMDHGPIISSQKIVMTPESIDSVELEKIMAEAGGKLLAETIPKWLSGELKAIPQNEAEASYSRKISKADGLINLEDSPLKNYRIYLALKDSVGVYFLAETKKGETKIKISKAKMDQEKFVIETVIPENKRSMAYRDFLMGL